MKRQESFLSVVLNKAYEERVPMCCTLELTKRCNFNCVHCYLKDNHNAEMFLEDAKNVIREIRDNGTLFLNLTGGEIFTYKYFDEIYQFAYESGMIISLLTNASLLSETIRKMLKKMPPRKIEVTLYGYDDKTMYEVTKQNIISSETILNNILKLKEDGHNILLKMIVLKENIKDFKIIKEFAEKYNIQFQYNFDIYPTILGDTEVIKHQLSVEEVIALELSDGKQKLWKSMLDNYDYNNNRKLGCGCGKYSYTISSELLVKKCNFIIDNCEKFNLKKNSFRAIWSIWKCEEKPIFEYIKCQKCKYQAVCNICPSMSYVLANDSDGTVERQCELAQKRYYLAYKDESYESSSN